MRIFVVGQSGSGKSTLSRELADHYRLPYVEMDQIWRKHRGFRLRAKTGAREKLKVEVDKAARRRDWLMDGKYTIVRQDLMKRADRIIYLKFPYWTTVRRLFRRELRDNHRLTWNFLIHLYQMARKFHWHKKNLQEELRPHRRKTTVFRTQKEVEIFVRKLEEAE